MTFVTNEKLAAYADGELDEAESAQVSRALAADELLRARLARITSLDDQLRAAYEIDDEDVPRRITRLLEPPRPPAYGRLRQWIPAGAAIAAGIAGLTVGGLLPAQSEDGWLKPHDGSLALAGAVQSAADLTPSGSRYVAGAMTAEPIVSFVAGDGRLCRELQIEEGRTATHAVACREQAEWRVEALVRGQAQSDATGYRPAGRRRDTAISAVHARLKITSVLDAKAEDEAIAAGWPAK
jgi:anti-sigma factor RsiW